MKEDKYQNEFSGHDSLVLYFITESSHVGIIFKWVKTYFAHKISEYVEMVDLKKNDTFSFSIYSEEHLFSFTEWI